MSSIYQAALAYEWSVNQALAGLFFGRPAFGDDIRNKAFQEFKPLGLSGKTHESVVNTTVRIVGE
jgi:hypothetical protein